MVEVFVAEGDVVEANAPLLAMETMKLTTTFRADVGGTVLEVAAQLDQAVREGDFLVQISDEAAPSTLRAWGARPRIAAEPGVESSVRRYRAR